MATGCPFGTHRVVKPAGVMPQAAETLSNELPIYDNECLIDVQTLNIDAASFRQMSEAAGGVPEKIGERIMETVRARGKQHNPVTGSGGMLLGRVKQLGPEFPSRLGLSVGDEIATLVSLSLTPLHLDEIVAVHRETDQVDVKGHAILFASGVAVRLPSDIPRRTALAVLDVAGAPIQTARLVKPGMTVLVLGMGKAGLLCLAQARRSLGGTGVLLGVERSEESIAAIRQLGLVDDAAVADATQPLQVFRAVEKLTGGRLCDVVINTANVPGTEMACILCAREGGKVYFFNTAVRFTAAALGAEGVGKDVELLIGNGYANENAKHSLELVRREAGVRSLLEKKYA
jgi:L-erythro-3,5-diaminohexanoate dehydrogenase